MDIENRHIETLDTIAGGDGGRALEIEAWKRKDLFEFWSHFRRLQIRLSGTPKAQIDKKSRR